MYNTCAYHPRHNLSENNNILQIFTLTRYCVLILLLQNKFLIYSFCMHIYVIKQW